MLKEQLQALLLFAAKNDVRFYLKGIYSDPSGYLVATDGHRILYIKTGEHGLDAIIPREAAEAAIKMAKKGQEIPLTRTSIGQITYTPVEAIYPDWRRVIPGSDNLQPNPQCLFEWQYLLDAEKAFKLMGADGVKLGFSDNQAIIANSNAVALVMGQHRRGAYLESYPKPQ
jgi:DNA polymerase III sliding clamp (beta) subunit (PCNA family)